MVDYKVEFGKKLRKYRQLAGLTQEQLAIRCGCSAQTISGAETGYSFPKSTYLFKIAQNLEIPLVYLFNFGEDENIQSKETLYVLNNLFNKLDNTQQNVILKVISELANS